MHRLKPFCAGIALAGMFWFSCPMGAEAAGLEAGAAAVDITPEQLPIRVAGSIQESYADRVTDRLHARSLALRHGSNQLALCIVDNCLIPRDLLDEAKAMASLKTGIPSDRLLIAATHTHSAPVVMGVHGNDPVPAYCEWLKERIAASIVQAWEKRVPARLGWGAGRCDDWVFCRRWLMKPGTALTVPFSGRETNQVQMNPGHDNPNKIRQTGPVDPEVTVLSVQTTAGQPLALLANYSTHYAGAPGISADYFGQFARIVAEKLQATNLSPAFVGILCNGTSGDANCIDFSRPRRDFNHHQVAETVAAVALEAARNISYSQTPTLAMLETNLTLAVRQPSPEEANAARTWLEENMPDGVVRNWQQNYARETVLLSELPDPRAQTAGHPGGDLRHHGDPLRGLWQHRSGPQESQPFPGHHEHQHGQRRRGLPAAARPACAGRLHHLARALQLPGGPG